MLKYGEDFNNFNLYLLNYTFRSHSHFFLPYIRSFVSGRPGRPCDTHIYSREGVRICVARYLFFTLTLSHVQYKCTYLTKTLQILLNRAYFILILLRDIQMKYQNESASS
jgi:hypothetical protein